MSRGRLYNKRRSGKAGYVLFCGAAFVFAFALILCQIVAVRTAYAYDKPYVGAMATHVAAYEDTFVKLARHYNMGFVELRAANPFIDPWLPGEGTEIILPGKRLIPKAPREGVIINLPEMRLYFFPGEGQAPETFPIGVGRVGLSTPIGQTTITRKMVGPIWRPTARMRAEDPSLPEVVRPGRDNPLGTHALYLGWPQYLIHGTNKPYGVGRRVSSGCVRLYPEDIITLYNIVPENTPVTVVDQPVKAAWIGERFYVEAVPSGAQADQVEQNGGFPDYEFTDRDMAVIMDAAGPDSGLIDWPLLRRVIRERAGYPVAVAMRSGGKQAAY